MIQRNDQLVKTRVVKKIFNLLVVLLLSFNRGSAFLIRSYSVLPSKKSPTSGYEFTVGRTLLDAKNKNNGPDDRTTLDPILILPITTAISCVLLVAGVLYYKANNPTVDFDLDFYMALDGVVGASPESRSEVIIGLPPLSPAEQLVGALFGPPSQ